MAVYAYLPCYHAVTADLRRPCNACECSNGGIVADAHIVGDMAEIVNLDPVTYDRGPDGRTVDCGTGSYFDIVPDNDIAKMLYLGPLSVFSPYIAESV